MDLERQKFLAALAVTGHVGKAADHAELSVASLYRWRRDDPEFAEAWNQAKQTRRELRAQDAWAAIDGLVADPQHARHFEAAKLAIEKNDPDAADRIDVRGTTTFVVESAFSHENRLTLGDVIALGPPDAATPALPETTETTS